MQIIKKQLIGRKKPHTEYSPLENDAIAELISIKKTRFSLRKMDGFQLFVLPQFSSISFSFYFHSRYFFGSL